MPPEARATCIRDVMQARMEQGYSYLEAHRFAGRQLEEMEQRQAERAQQQRNAKKARQ